jgi:hypothetical protein
MTKPDVAQNACMDSPCSAPEASFNLRLATCAQDASNIAGLHGNGGSIRPLPTMPCWVRCQVQHKISLACRQQQATAATEMPAATFPSVCLQVGIDLSIKDQAEQQWQ